MKEKNKYGIQQDRGCVDTNSYYSSSLWRFYK